MFFFSNNNNNNNIEHWILCTRRDHTHTESFTG